MTPEVKKQVRRYGIPIDLVILATGAAMLFPALSGTALIILYIAAVALSAWKLGWRSGLTAMIASLAVLLFGFGASVNAGHALAFIGVSGILIAVTQGRALMSTPDVHEVSAPAWAPPPPVVDELVAGESAAGARDREEIERAAAARAEEARLEAERAAEERLRRSRDDLARQLEENRAAIEREAEERIARENEQHLAAERAAEERLQLATRERERLEQQREELSRRLDEERIAAEKAAASRTDDERREAERVAEERLAAERKQLDREREEVARKFVAEREDAARVAAARGEEERLAAERAAEERWAAQRDERERLEREKEELTRKLAAERGAEEQLATERAAREKVEQEKNELARALEEQRKKHEEELRAATEKALSNTAPAPQPPEPERGTGIISTLTSWLKPHAQQPPSSVNLKLKHGTRAAAPAKSILPAPPPARSKTAAQPRERRPRVLMLERRRGTADTIAPRLRDAGIEVQIVERWIDAVDELFRFRPDAIFVDSEIGELPKVHQSISEQAPKLPIILTAASHGAIARLPRAASVVRPYTVDGIVALAREAMSNPDPLLERQLRPAATPPRPSKPRIAAVEPLVAGPMPIVETPAGADDRYDVVCFNCRVAFDATDADWCSCLTKERTLVCTNCLTCFCKAPPSYKENFWVKAPPKLFERKTGELRKQQTAMPANASPVLAKRPLVLLVEDDEDIQIIVHRVCTNLGYGFVVASNGQDGLQLARMYRPNMILSDAFMPKLDGREMCRILKEEAIIPDCRMIVMTGLYTDTKYKSEALKRFHIDDYLSKPVSITDLINLLQKHLEGAPSPEPEDLHELHRKQMEDDTAEANVEEEFGDEHSIELSDLIDQPSADSRFPVSAEPRSKAKYYEVCCFTCGETFDAAKAEWCTCLGRDQTLLCPHCNTCFCKAPAAYKERFWMDAPSTLFERKMIGSKRGGAGKGNPSPMEVKRPLILLVEDDENIQLIVKTVVMTMGYGFIVAANGQEGLAMAREYNPDLILSDAFMPKLDGREMCRLLKEDPVTARAKAIIMTGLYTDRKYRNEALSYFKVDDYVAKPVAVDDLIKLMKKHLPQDVQPTM